MIHLEILNGRRAKLRFQDWGEGGFDEEAKWVKLIKTIAWT